MERAPNKLVTIISATATQRIVIVGCKLRIAVLCGTSRIERKHKPSAIMAAMPMVSLDAMLLLDGWFVYRDRPFRKRKSREVFIFSSLLIFQAPLVRLSKHPSPGTHFAQALYFQHDCPNNIQRTVRILKSWFVYQNCVLDSLDPPHLPKSLVL